jgi:PAS domain S-box-containing protein
MDDHPRRILDQALLGEALLTAGSAVLVSDDEGRYLAVNDAACRLLGYTRAEFNTLNARMVTARGEEELAEVYAQLKRHKSVEEVGRIRRKDGVEGMIGYVGLTATVGGLPVFVSITAPIDTFKPIP